LVPHRRVRDQGSAADGGTYDEAGTDEHEILDDVLPLKCWRVMDLVKHLMREEEYGSDRPDRLDEEQQ
jgi:hypothetical protein